MRNSRKRFFDKISPVLSTTAGVMNMHNEVSENPSVGVGAVSGAVHKGLLGYSTGGVKGLVTGGVLGGITGALSILNRKEQDVRVERDEYLNNLYGSVVGDDYDLGLMANMKYGGVIGVGDEELTPIQGEARYVGKGRKKKLVKEKILLKDGLIVETNADKPHSEMDDEEVTDMLPESYVFPVFVKLNKKDIELPIAQTAGHYSEKKNVKGEEISLKNILGKDFEGSFAEAAEVVRKNFPIVEDEMLDKSDRIAVTTNNENKKHRMSYLRHLIMLNDSKTEKREIEEVTMIPSGYY